MQRLATVGYGLLLLTSLPAAAGEKGMVSFRQIIEDGGVMMWVLILLSLCVTILVVFFLLTLRLSVLMPERFQVEAEDIAQQGDAEALTAACRESRCPGARVVGAAASVLQVMPEAGYDVLRDALEDEGARQAGGMWRRVQYLADIATVAPMVGLLGTVLGMIEAFVGLKDSFGAVRPIGLANGVSKALVTTAGGLFVGIVAMLLYSYFRGRVGRLVGHLEEQCNTILQHLLVSRAEQARRVASPRATDA